MREIKFRAWDRKNRAMVQVWAINWTGFDGKQASSFFAVNPVIKGEYVLKQEHSELMQYTGLKDKNGEEVYEGDILKVNYQIYINGYIQDMRLKAEIIFHSAAFCLSYDSEEDGSVIVPIDSFHIPLDPDCDLQVIGNIYEHPHLLKA